MSAPETDDRLICLETAVAHLQHDLEQMHQALLGLHSELKGSREQLARLERKLQQLAEPPEHRDPGDERPPHY
jgi:SlyX protein